MSKENNPKIQIIVALIAATAVIISAYFSWKAAREPVLLEIEATQNAEIRLTNDATQREVSNSGLTPARETPAIIEIIPTSTVTPYPSVTITKTPTFVIQSARGIHIRELGEISIGVHQDDMYLYPLFFREGDAYYGFEWELATEIVKRLFGDKVTINWVHLTAPERLGAVQDGSVDFLICNTTHTLTREELVLFSHNYFLDGVRLLVRRNDGYENIEDLDGKTIVAPSEFFASPLENAAVNAGIRVNILVDENAKTIFQEKRADAVSVDWGSHSAFVDDYSEHKAIGNLLSSEPLAIAVSHDSPDFRDEIDTVLLEIIEDGTWQMIYARWFPENPPWTIEDMLAEPPADR